MGSDNGNKAAKTLANMFAGVAIECYSLNGGTLTFTLTCGDTIAIRHEIKEVSLTSCGFDRKERKYVSGGIAPRVQESMKSGRAILSAWVEKRKEYQPPTTYDEHNETPGETTETIELWVMYNNDLRPTLLTDNTTRYSWKAEHPDFTIKRGSVSVTADSARISSSFHRPCDE